MSYFREALRFKNDIIHRILQKNPKIPYEYGEEVGAIFLDSELTFEDFVIDTARRERCSITVDFIAFCTEEAILLIFKDLLGTEERRERRSSSNYRFGDFNRDVPSYDRGGFRFKEERRSKNNNRDLKKMFGNNRRDEEEEEINTSKRSIRKGNTLFEDNVVRDKTSKSNNNVERDDILVDGEVIIEKLNSTSSAFSVRSVAQILGVTLKNHDAGIFKIVREVFSLKEGKNEKVIKVDGIDFTNYLAAFDSTYDMYQFLEANLNREDCSWSYIRTVNYPVIDCIEYDHDLFFHSYDILVEKIKNAIGRYNEKDDIFALTKKLEDTIEIFKETSDSDFKKVFENYLLDIVNRKIGLHLRMSTKPASRYKIEELSDLFVFFRDPTYEKMHSFKGFEIEMVNILVTCLDLFTGQGDICPIQFENDSSFYIRSRKFMSIDNDSAACSFDYWKYVSENRESIKNKLIQKMKERVIFIRPRRTIITNIFSPHFLRLVERTKKSLIVDPKRKDNPIFGFLNELITIKNLPDDLLLILNNKGEYKNFDLGMTLDAHVIIE